MPAKLTRRFNLHIADTFKSQVSRGDDQLYVFFSRVHPWANGASNPDPVVDTIQYSDYDVWRGMLGLKKISNNDVSFAAKRYDWTSGTVYAQYNNFDSNLFTKAYYVYTDESNIYKCLYNNKGAASTVKPTGQSTSKIVTDDGYIWKFMYNITPAEQNKYQTATFIPAKRVGDSLSPQEAVTAAAVRGSVEVIEISNGGNNYVTAVGNVVLASNSTSVALLDIDVNQTDGFYNNFNLYITGGTGAGQIKTISQWIGTTSTARTSEAFTTAPDSTSKFHIGPRINITGDGSNATAFANVISGQITKATIINGGSNYSRVIATIPSYSDSGSTPRGSGALATPYLSPLGGHGFDPVSELNATNVVINTALIGGSNSTGDGPTLIANNDFRIYGLLKNPIVRRSGLGDVAGAVATNIRYNQTTRLGSYNKTGTFLQDEFVTGGTSGASGRVVTYDLDVVSGKEVLYLTNVDGTFSNNELLTANSSGTTMTANGVTLSDLLPFRGEVLYTVNRQAIVRDIDQTENITITVKF